MPTNVTQINPQTLLKINYLKFLQMLFKLTHEHYLRLTLRALLNLKFICKDCTIKTSNKIKQNCAKKRY